MTAGALHHHPRAVGDRVGRYVLRSLLGQGSMGAVWIADDTMLDIPIALKLLHVSASSGAERLLREAQAVALVKHPSIVRVLDFGVSDVGEPYLALELLEGETVTSMVARGRVSAETVAGLALPLLDALAVAHAAGVVHRDIKPDNLFITRDARGRLHPKLLDFGIAVRPSSQRRRLTAHGMLVGTPPYMAPEQARGEASIDGRADLWALAATMYELVSGAPPFIASTTPNLLMAVIAQHPPSLTAMGVDAAFARIIERALEKDRTDRFPDARSMGDAVAAWLLSRGIGEDSCGTSVRSAWLVGAAALPAPACPPSSRLMMASMPTLDGGMPPAAPVARRGLVLPTLAAAAVAALLALMGTGASSGAAASSARAPLAAIAVPIAPSSSAAPIASESPAVEPTAVLPPPSASSVRARGVASARRGTRSWY